jgi:hypothetical protein
MKNKRVFLHNWQGDCTDGYVDIPWPLIHQIVGSEQITWLQNQEISGAQLILDKTADGWQSLWAEFYSDKVHLEYILRFAK